MWIQANRCSNSTTVIVEGSIRVAARRLVSFVNACTITNITNTCRQTSQTPVGWGNSTLQPRGSLRLRSCCAEVIVFYLSAALSTSFSKLQSQAHNPSRNWDTDGASRISDITQRLACSYCCKLQRIAGGKHFWEVSQSNISLGKGVGLHDFSDDKPM